MYKSEYNNADFRDKYFLIVLIVWAAHLRMFAQWHIPEIVIITAMLGLILIQNTKESHFIL